MIRPAPFPLPLQFLRAENILNGSLFKSSVTYVGITVGRVPASAGICYIELNAFIASRAAHSNEHEKCVKDGHEMHMEHTNETVFGGVMLARRVGFCGLSRDHTQ